MMSLLFPLWFGIFGGMGGTAPVSESPETVRAQYEAAASHLETGGDFYAVNSIDGKLDAMLDSLGHVAGWSQPGNGGNDMLSRVKDYLRIHGAMATHTLAGSTVPRKDGLRDIRFYIGRNPAAAEKALWRGVVGGAPRQPTRLASLPADTVLALETSIEANRLWAMVSDGLLRFGCQNDPVKLAEMLAEAKRETGVDLNVLFNSLKPDITLSVQLDSEKVMQFPGPDGDAMTIPKPGFLLLAGAKNDAAQRFLLAAFEEEGKILQSVKIGNGTMYQWAEPSRDPFALQLAVMLHEGTLYFASHPDLIQDQLDRADNGTLGDTERFTETFKPLPGKGNMFFYCDARFRSTLTEMTKTMRQDQPQLRGMATTVLHMLLNYELPELSSGWVAVNGKEAVLLTGTGQGDFVRQWTNGNGMLPFMMLAGMVTRLESGRTHAVAPRNRARQNACINNLRQIDGAKQQWALETNAAADAMPAAADISLYLDGGFEAIECPAGGDYSINSMQQKPTCSHPGHEMP